MKQTFFAHIPANYTPRQKFFRGDVVLVSPEPPGKGAQHLGIILGSHEDIHGGCRYSDEGAKYTILFEGGPMFGPVALSWYGENRIDPAPGFTRDDGERILQYVHETKHGRIVT